MNEYRMNDITVGLTHSFSTTVTEQNIAQFTEMSGDINPLHIDKSYARLNGFPDRVVYGMLTASYYSTLVGVYLPGKFALLQGVDVSFIKPVYPGDSLTIFGEVVSVHDAVGQIEIRAHITNQNGIKVSRAKIRSGFHGD